MFRLVLLVSAFAFLVQSKVVHTETGVIEYDDEPTLKQGIRAARRLQTNQAQMLDKHNALRRIVSQGNTPGQPRASNMLQLLWDPALESVATTYASQCDWQHNSGRTSEYNAKANKLMTGNSYVGENLYMTSNAQAGISTMLSGIQSWYDEYKDYTYSTGGCTGVCGHYTQVVWAKTLYVGCGFASCTNGVANSGGWRTATILVCNYSPGGNYNGQKPYTTGGTCSSCPAAQNTCSNSLCVAAGGGGPTPTTTTARPQPTTTTARPQPTTAKPTPPPVTPTRRPTPPPVNTGGNSGDGSCYSGLTGTMGFYFLNSDATCPDYIKALIMFQPCVGKVLSCTDEKYPGYSAYRRVRIKWQTNRAKWGLGFSAWRNGIKKNLGILGIQFTGAANQGTPPADTGALETSSPSSEPKASATPMIIGVVLGVMAFIVISVGLGCYWYSRQQKSQDTAEFRMMQEQRTGQYNPPTAPIIS